MMPKRDPARLEKQENQGFLGELAGEPGFEPGLTESESVGLPLTYSPRIVRRRASFGVGGL